MSQNSVKKLGKWLGLQVFPLVGAVLFLVTFGPPKSKSEWRAKKVTLLEVVVVLAILVILTCLILPMFGR